ncbi:MAG: primosomal protein N' [Muribaculaceae bacterium]|nr:primosomal protein N' [Muribaculaceae bacterium]
MKALYAQVILPLPLAGNFTYIVPEALQPRIRSGMRVAVQFGAKRFYTGIVASITPVAPPLGIKLKEIALLLDNEPIVTNLQMRFWEWMSEYYLCSIGEVYKAALPSGLKIESETRIEIDSEATDEQFAECTETELQILEYLKSKKSATVEAIEKGLKATDIGSTISQMTERGLLAVSEKLVERYRVVKQQYVRPLIARNDADALDKAFSAVKRKQEEALVALIALSGFYKNDVPLAEVPLDVLCERANVSRPIIKALCDKGLCEIYYKEISRFSYSGVSSGILPVLSDAQKKAYNEIMFSFADKNVCLLHGVTASGKTEVYIHLIEYVMKQGKQVLFLVPEIALTTQLTRRLQKVFGEKVIIYHSKFSDNERVELYRRILNCKEPIVAIGARSACFLPFERLGLVIVDEEHESSYKQYDPAPRYNGRDAATMLATMHGAKTLYGSATPSVETYYKAVHGKFGLVKLLERYDGVSLPQIELIDMKAERRKGKVSGFLSHRLLDATLSTTGAHKQAILFHNRRGYAPMARCRMCAFTPKCDFCDVALTYHRRDNKLQCHYCGAEYQVPTVCPECKEPTIEIVGYGTERLEEEIAASFRDRKVLRMDLDTTRNKDGYSRIIDEFSQHKADILVGTQMISKGLDFGEVELVGVLNADSLINFPDFRSAERAFNMIEQVAGRAGRRDGKGLVLIQAYNPGHHILEYATTHDYEAFYNHELEERRAFNFPPFSRIINIYVKHREASTTAECASIYAASLRKIFGTRISGPQEPNVGRIQSMYIRKIMLKAEPSISMKQVKTILRNEYVKLSSDPLMRSLTIYYDVDPS